MKNINSTRITIVSKESGLHYQTTDWDSNDPIIQAYPRGGGFVMNLTRHDFRLATPEELEGTLKEGWFGFDEGPHFKGYYDPNNRWNGWANPRFEAETMREIADFFGVWDAEHEVGIEFKEHKQFEQAGNQEFLTEVGFQMIEHGCGEDGIGEVDWGTIIDGKRVYNAGGGCLTWDDVDAKLICPKCNHVMMRERQNSDEVHYTCTNFGECDHFQSDIEPELR